MMIIMMMMMHTFVVVEGWENACATLFVDWVDNRVFVNFVEGLF